MGNCYFQAIEASLSNWNFFNVSRQWDLSLQVGECLWGNSEPLQISGLGPSLAPIDLSEDRVRPQAIIERTPPHIFDTELVTSPLL